jgi:hypothetical protein
MKDYSVTLQDSKGRVVVLNINGDTIFELTNDGFSLEQAKSCVQDNEFQNAIAKDIIGPDAFVA